MTNYNKGDKIRAIREARSWRNYDDTLAAGTVVTFRHIDKWGAADDGYTIAIEEGGIYNAEDFVLASGYTFDPGGTVISYDDVQEGDTIAALTYESWRIGKVRGKNEYNISGGGILAYSDSDTTEIRLLNRPEPEVDRAAVEALSDAIESLDFDTDIEGIATQLIKAGVTVGA